MKKSMILLILFTISCTPKAEQSSIDITAYQWEDIIEQSKDSEVTLYMWGGSEIINNAIDNVIAPRLKELNNMTLTRVPVSDIKDTVNKLIVEKKAQKNKGSVDVMWINGENFAMMKDSQSLWGTFAKRLPSIAFVKDSTLDTDFGTPVEYYQAPWGDSQFNFIYKGLAPIPFTSAEELLAYAKANPGRFTYPAIPDFTGSAFVRNIVLDILGAEEVQAMSDEEFTLALNKVWDYFNELNPYLWKEGKTYPESLGKLELLFNNNNVDIMMNYTISHVSQKIVTKEYPSTSKSFLLDKGTLFNNHYLSIPWNAGNKAGALYLINYLLSAEAQLLKIDPAVWGDATVLDFNKINDPQIKKSFDSFAQGQGMVSDEELSTKRISELTTSKLNIIEKMWLANIVYSIE